MEDDVEVSPGRLLTTPTMVKLVSIASLAFLVLSCYGSYQPASPPYSLTIAYPSVNPVVGETMEIGFAEPAIPRAYYGLTYNVSLSLTYPNGTSFPATVSISNAPQGAKVCRGNSSGTESQSSDTIPFGTRVPASGAGR